MNFLNRLIFDIYPVYKNIVEFFSLILPIFFMILIYRRIWIGFLLGLISSSLISISTLVLECVKPEQYCSSDNFEEGTYIMMMIFSFFYNLLILSIISYFKYLAKEIRR
jgi:hypothetical protein